VRRLFILGAFISKFLGVILLDAPALNVLPPVQMTEERRFKITFYCSDKRCCGRHSPQAGGKGNTALGHAPIPFRTAASGDPALVGRWVLLPDLHGEVFVSDTGVKCGKRSDGTSVPARRVKKKPRPQKGCVAPNQLDIFVGGPEWHNAAARLGVQEWVGRVEK